jgi:hypothetical protein
LTAVAPGETVPNHSPEDVCRHTSEQFRKSETAEHYAMVWNAALRLIEDGKPDYRS